VAQRPAYHRKTTPLGVRMPEDTRRIFEWLALQAGAPSVSHYMRGVYEKHLLDLGFKLEPGVTAALPPPPSPEAVAEWQAEEEGRGQEPD
jgi:hypothetical protein